jgi:chromosomal replication initiation ATPase DnaA
MYLMTTKNAQYPLALATPTAYDKANFFVTPAHAPALTMLEAWPAWTDKLLLIVGEPASGKTHLGHIWAEQSHAQWLTPATLDNRCIEGLRPRCAYILDDLPAAIPDTLLFHFINRVREIEAYALLLAASDPVHWPQQLPDVQSRLKSLPRATIGAPEDGLVMALMVKAFADAQVHVEDDVVQYLLPRVERSFTSVQRVLMAITQRAYAEQRAITIPLAKQVLAA